MSNSKKYLPNYTEINDFLESITTVHRTSNPLFYILKLLPFDTSIKAIKAPYRKDFYFFSLITSAIGTEISYDSQELNKVNSFLTFQCPGQVYSFNRTKEANGYVIYFKKDVFDFMKIDIENSFPFFNMLNRNFYQITHDQFLTFENKFQDIFQENLNSKDSTNKLIYYKLLVLLQELKLFTSTTNEIQQSFQSTNEIIYRNFLLSVNKFYLTKKTVDEYADLLHISSNHLSKVVKSIGAKNALQIINDRLILEAKNLIQYTTDDISEIAYQLSYHDVGNFSKFFKKHTGKTPLAFRKEFAMNLK